MTRLAVAVVCALLLLGACDSIKDVLDTETEPPPLPGERISVLVLEHDLKPDPEIVNQPVRLPRPVVNRTWPQAGGTPTHVMEHLAADGDLKPIWHRNIGAGETDDNLILSSPVIANDTIYVLDAKSTVTAVSLRTGEVMWVAPLIPKGEEEDASFGGGIAYDRGALYVATAYGYVVALNADNGGLYWWQRLGAPLRGAPTVADGRVFVITFDNQLYALDDRDGSTLWSHTGLSESAGLLGAASPAVAQGMVVASYSSGELVALRIENGRVAWSDSLVFQGRMGANTSLSDIDASPVIDNGVVYAVSHSGRLVAIDLRSGVRIWDQELASAQTPWVAGDYLYVLTVNAEIVCVRRLDGRVRWVRPLPKYVDPERRNKPIIWTGPVLVGDRLIVAANTGEAVAVSPYTGRLLGRIELPDGVRVPPIIARGIVYVLTTNAEVVALR